MSAWEKNKQKNTEYTYLAAERVVPPLMESGAMFHRCSAGRGYGALGDAESLAGEGRYLTTYCSSCAKTGPGKR